MKALEYRRSIPRFAALNLFGPRFKGLYTSGVVPISLRDMPPPRLPREDWVRVAPKLAGICGSDLATITAKGSPYLAPITSMPFVLGHELVGRVTEVGKEVTRVREGDRVVIHPALGCRVRGIVPVCAACAGGRDALCRNVARGIISPGIQTGYCRDTGGGFSQGLVAHESQVYIVPDEISDAAAVLIEPFACALHGALRVTLAGDATALVIGCGSIGLLTIAALRATGFTGRLLAVAKYDHQKERALAFGADELLPAGGKLRARYDDWANMLDAQVFDPELGKPTVLGGADAVFDCVASGSSIDDGIRFTRSGGDFVLVGMPGIPRGIDWTPLWFGELSLHAAYAYGPERYAGGERETFDIAIELAKTWGGKLATMVGKPYDLSDYRSAFRSALYTGESKAAKTIFQIDGE